MVRQHRQDPSAWTTSSADTPCPCGYFGQCTLNLEEHVWVYYLSAPGKKTKNAADGREFTTRWSDTKKRSQVKTSQSQPSATDAPVIADPETLLSQQDLAALGFSFQDIQRRFPWTIEYTSLAGKPVFRVEDLKEVLP